MQCLRMSKIVNYNTVFNATTGVARIFQQLGQSEGAKRPSGGGGGTRVWPSHDGEILKIVCIKMLFFAH